MELVIKQRWRVTRKVIILVFYGIKSMFTNLERRKKQQNQTEMPLCGSMEGLIGNIF